MPRSTTKFIWTKEMMKSLLIRCFEVHVEEEPRHIKEARAKLETLKEVKERHFGNAHLLLGHKSLVCCFCGPHLFLLKRLRAR
ncbi:hypothetical protein Aduo_009631 [Ancylostoma duodenale]